MSLPDPGENRPLQKKKFWHRWNILHPPKLEKMELFYFWALFSPLIALGLPLKNSRLKKNDFEKKP